MKDSKLYKIETRFDQGVNSSSQIIKAKMRNALGFLSDWAIDLMAGAIIGIGKIIFGIVNISVRNYNRHYKGKHEA